MAKKNENEPTKNIKCPHCSTVVAWAGALEDRGAITCANPDCRKEYHYQRHTTVKYTVSKP